MQISLDELFQRIEAAQQRMSRKNPHRLLLHQCREVITHMSAGIRMLEQRLGPVYAPIQSVQISHKKPALTPPPSAAEPSRVETHAEGAPQAI